jgi:hypothetical protein
MKFDIIGDVHGQYHKLVGLLRHLGYEPHQDTWKHPRRTAIFVGDLIDRGPDQVQTVELVRRMEAIGAAYWVITNSMPSPGPHRILRIPVSGFAITTRPAIGSSTRPF